MNDLGYIRPKTDENAAVTQPIGRPDDNKPEYPTLCLNGIQTEKAQLQHIAFGDVYEIKLQVRIRKVGSDRWEQRETGTDKPSVEFDVLASDTPKLVTSPEEDAEETAPPKRQKGVMLSPKDAGLETDDEDDTEEED